MDVFVRDRATHRTVRVSISSSGRQGNRDSGGASLSADGNSVAFWSDASNLVPDDHNGVRDIFVRDMVAHRTVRVSVSFEGAEANGASSPGTDSPHGGRRGFRPPVISGDGRSVAFESTASNLAPGDSNGETDIFVRDLRGKRTVAASVRPDGNTANGASTWPAVSQDGRYVAFASSASDLLANGDTNGVEDVFVRDLQEERTVRASVAPNGSQFTDPSYSPALSGDGRVIAFGGPNADPEQPYQGSIYMRDLDASTSEVVATCDERCGRFALSGDGGVLAFGRWNPGPDPFCWVIDRPKRRREENIGACNPDEISISPDGRYVAFNAGIDPYSLDENQYGGDFGAMVYDRRTDRYKAAWKW